MQFIIIQVAEEINSKSLKIQDVDLYGICVEKCPDMGDVICNGLIEDVSVLLQLDTKFNRLS